MTLHPQTVRDVIGVVGVALLGYGAWCHYHPLGYMAAGASLILLTAIGTIRGRG